MGDRDIKVDDEACTGNTARGHRWRVVLRRAAGAWLADAGVRRGDLRAPLSAWCRGGWTCCASGLRKQAGSRQRCRCSAGPAPRIPRSDAGAIAA